MKRKMRRAKSRQERRIARIAAGCRKYAYVREAM
jgi:hypothetical protein